MKKTNDFRWNRVKWTLPSKEWECRFFGKRVFTGRTRERSVHRSLHLEQRCIMDDGSEEWNEIDFVNTESKAR